MKTLLRLLGRLFAKSMFYVEGLLDNLLDAFSEGVDEVIDAHLHEKYMEDN